MVRSGSKISSNRIVRTRQLIADLRDVRYALVAASLLLIAGFGVGFWIHEPAAGSVGEAETATLFDFENPTVVDLAVNNLLVVVSLLGGAITLGALSISGILYNGFLLGTIVKSLLVGGAEPATIVLSILPHAIFELPALVLAAAIGLSLSKSVWLYLFELRESPPSRREVWRGIRLTVIATVLILAAACVEILVTQQLV